MPDHARLSDLGREVDDRSNDALGLDRPGNDAARVDSFETQAVETPMGAFRPCLGVYTVDGVACGVYGRLSKGQVIDYAAMDVAVLVEERAE